MSTVKGPVIGLILTVAHMRMRRLHLQALRGAICGHWCRFKVCIGTLSKYTHNPD